MAYNRLKFSFLIYLFLFSSIYAQNGTDSTDTKNLKVIYSNLEYNTIAYNDLKVKWVISDPDLVRDVFNRFVVNDALRLNGNRITKQILQKKAEEVFEGNIVLDLRKRYYDDEIEFFAFITEEELNNMEPKYLFDPVVDGYYLREIINGKLYSLLQNKEYYFQDITKKSYDVKPGYFFDINLNLTNPELMFWATTSEYRNKYLVSIIGEWGNNDVYLPGWYNSDYFGAVQLKYYDFLKSDPNDHTYKVAIGTGFKSGTPYISVLPESPLVKSSENLFFNFNGDVFKNIHPSLSGYYLDFTGALAFRDYEMTDFDFVDTTNFYSIPDFFSFSVTKRKIFNIFDFGNLLAGGGISSHSEKYYRFIPGANSLIDIYNKDFFDTFNHTIFAKVGVEKYGGLVQHHIIFNLGYGLNQEYFAFGIDMKMMLSDLIGLSIKYNSISGYNESRYPYRTDTQIIFSPILRINY